MHKSVGVVVVPVGNEVVGGYAVVDKAVESYAAVNKAHDVVESVCLSLIIPVCLLPYDRHVVAHKQGVSELHVILIGNKSPKVCAGCKEVVPYAPEYGVKYAEKRVFRKNPYNKVKGKARKAVNK